MARTLAGGERRASGLRCAVAGVLTAAGDAAGTTEVVGCCRGLNAGQFSSPKRASASCVAASQSAQCCAAMWPT